MKEEALARICFARGDPSDVMNPARTTLPTERQSSPVRAHRDERPPAVPRSCRGHDRPDAVAPPKAATEGEDRSVSNNRALPHSPSVMPAACELPREGGGPNQRAECNQPWVLAVTAVAPNTRSASTPAHTLRPRNAKSPAPADRRAGPFTLANRDDYEAGDRFTAAYLPRRSTSSSNCSLSPSFSVPMPARSTAEMWTNASGWPSSR